MALLDNFFGGNASANPLDQIRNGLLGDLLAKIKTGQMPEGVGTETILKGMQPEPAPMPKMAPAQAPTTTGWEPEVTREVGMLNQGMPYTPVSAVASAPAAPRVPDAGGGLPDATAGPAAAPFAPSFRDRFLGAMKALQGQDPGDLDKAAEAKNQTFNFLTGRGIKPDEARSLVSNPALLQAALPVIFGGKTQMRLEEIFDAQGRKQKVLLNPQTGAYQPLGGAAAAEKLDLGEIYDDKGHKQKVLINPATGAAKTIGGPAFAKPDENLTTAQKTVDREFGKDYAEFVQGGFADAQKNLDQLRIVQRELSDPKGPNLTGPLLGLTPNAIRAFTHPQSVDRREMVEEVVQRNLRVVLGAQFTEKEGERLIARAYNEKLDEKTNAERLGRLIGAMDAALKAKMAAGEYYEKNGTLAGFKGQTRFSIADFDAAMERPATGAGKASIGGKPDKATALDQAKQAIAAGKDPDAVRARLREWGYELD